MFLAPDGGEIEVANAAATFLADAIPLDRSWVLTIAGGTSEILREITADRLLGLPRAR